MNEDCIRDVRRALLCVQESWIMDAKSSLPLASMALDRVLDAWDEFEYEAGTAETVES